MEKAKGRLSAADVNLLTAVIVDLWGQNISKYQEVFLLWFLELNIL